MNRSIFPLFFLTLLCSALFVACDDDDKDNGTDTIAVTGIALDETTMALSPNATHTLTATISPEGASDQTVTWTTSDESVATVSAGVVTAVANGEATITASVDDGAFTATCVVTVTTEVTGITLDPTELTLAIDETATLTATLSPEGASNQTITWTSSNETVATVSDAGVVTAVANGEATITAAAEGGTFTATCAVTVAIPVTGITLDETELTLNSGNTYTLTATVSPSDATDASVTWTSDDETVATVSASGTITAVDQGIVNITATTTDGSYTATCAVTVATNTYAFNGSTKSVVENAVQDVNDGYLLLLYPENVADGVGTDTDDYAAVFMKYDWVTTIIDMTEATTSNEWGLGCYENGTLNIGLSSTDVSSIKSGTISSEIEVTTSYEYILKVIFDVTLNDGTTFKGSYYGGIDYFQF